MFMFDEEQVTEKTSPCTVNELTDLHVDRVDLVKAGSVRDPDHPDQAARFLVIKSEQRQPFSRQSVVKGESMSEGEYRRANRALKAQSLQGRRGAAFGGGADPHRVTQTGTRGGGDPYEQFERLVDEHMNNNPHMTRAEASSNVQRTPQGQALAEQIRAAGLPTLKSDIPEQMAEREIRALAKSEQERNPSLTEEQAIRVVMMDRQNRDVVADYSRSHYDSATPVQPVDVRRRDAEYTLTRLVEREMDRSHINKAEATARVIEDDPGRTAWAILRGQPMRERPSLPISKADEPYNQLVRKAEEIRRTNPKLSLARAIVQAAQSNPDLANAYNDRVRAELQAKAQAG